MEPPWGRLGPAASVRIALAGWLVLASLSAGAAGGPSGRGPALTARPAAEAQATVGAEEAQLTTSAGAVGDLLGDAVAVSGGTAVVGAQADDTAGGVNAGTATVFERSGQSWTEQQTLEASNGATFDAFGWSVAIAGDTIVVGAPIADSGAGAESGAAYVFVRSGGTWVEQRILTASDAVQDGHFGDSVAISGDTVVVGSDFADVPPAGSTGAAYVFTRAGSTWTEQQKLTASDGIPSAHFGTSVDVEGDRVLVGAESAPGPSLAGTGAAYSFVRSGSTWTEEGEFGPSDGASHDFFGASVALDGDTAVVGAPAHDTDGLSSAGAAYAFLRSGGTWVEQSQLLPPFAVAGDQFGHAVDLDGDAAVVGDPFDGTAGSAFVFARRGSAWTRDQKLNPAEAASAAQAGISVAIAPGLALVGAWQDSPPAGSLAGAAYVFRLSEQLLADDPAADDDLGRSVAVDGGLAVVGAYLADPLGSGSGAAYVFVRSETGWTQEAKLTASDGAAGDQFGFSVALDGDTAVVGAPNADTVAGSDAGAAYVFVRAGTTWTEQQKLGPAVGGSLDQFGYSVALDGDTAVAGAHLADTTAGVDAGEAFVFVRSGTTWTEEKKLKASNAAAGDRFGRSVGVAGDTAVVGADLADPSGLAGAGSAYVFLRSGAAWTEQQILSAPDGAAGDSFGAAVAADADTALVGAPLHDTTAGADAGQAYVFARSAGVWTLEKKLKASDAAANDQLGSAVAVEGDAAVAGAPFHEPPGGIQNGGAAYRFIRNGTVWSQEERLTAAAPLVEDELGRSVDLSGPLVLAGAPLHLLVGLPHAGAAYVFEQPGVRASISSFTPATAKVGVDVVVSGSGFTGATAVAFGGVAASFTVVGDDEIDAEVPAGGLTGPITVTTTWGTDATAVDFLVKPATKRFTPASGPVGTPVTIKGSGFTQATKVKFDRTPAVFTVVSDTTISATVPAGASTGKISVVTPGGTGKSRDAFVVTAGAADGRGPIRRR